MQRGGCITGFGNPMVEEAPYPFHVAHTRSDDDEVIAIQRTILIDLQNERDSLHRSVASTKPSSPPAAASSVSSSSNARDVACHRVMDMIEKRSPNDDERMGEGWGPYRVQNPVGILNAPTLWIALNMVFAII
jgi:hypothetical protein